MNIRIRSTAEAILIPVGAMLVSLLLFGIFCAALGANPFGVYASIYKAAFADWYSWQNTLTRAAPLMLCALCTALPARAGVIVIGNEGAVVVGGLGAAFIGLAFGSAGHLGSLALMVVASMLCGGLWIMFVAALQHYRGVNVVIGSLLMNYLAIALLNQMVEGPMRDPASLNSPASYPLLDIHRLPYLEGTNIHYGLIFGLVACATAWFLVQRTTFGFQVKVIGGNIRAARLAGLPVGRLLLITSFLGGACAGVAGMVEVAAVHGRANESLNAGYGYVGILVAFLAQQNPAAVMVVSILFGGLLASGGMLQRAHNLPDSTVMVLQGIVFLVILLSETLQGRFQLFRERETEHVAVAAAGR